MFFNRLYKKADLKESVENLCNPERGFYQIFTVEIGKKTDYVLFSECLLESESIVLLVVDIGKYKNEPLSEAALDEMREAICFFANQNKEIILRVVYDHEGNALEREPDEFSLVKQHLQAVAKWMEPWKQHIFIFQGMLIGNWGEMHTTKFLGRGQLRELVEILDEELEQSTFLAVRKPVFYRMLRMNHMGNNKGNGCKIGLYNDAILASETDMGTYGNGEETNWEKAWSRKEELEFQDTLCKAVPNGGEAVYGEGFIDKISTDDMLHCLRKMHISYLNRLYDGKILNLWKEKKYNGRDVWQGKSVYEYVQAHLGYRFVIRDFKVCMEGERQNKKYVQAVVCIENSGFANAYSEIRLEVIAQTQLAEKKIPVCGDLCDILSGTQEAFSFQFRVCQKKKNDVLFYLRAFRAKDGKIIHFGNTEQNGKVYIGKLMNYEIDEVVS